MHHMSSKRPRESEKMCGGQEKEKKLGDKLRGGERW